MKHGRTREEELRRNPIRKLESLLNLNRTLHAGLRNADVRNPHGRSLHRSPFVSS